MEQILEVIQTWFQLCKLSLNLNKTMIFGNRKNTIEVPFRIDDAEIYRMREVKVLGNVTDKKLTRKSHKNSLRIKKS